MKANSIINKIIINNSCSICDAKKITIALHREGILHDDLALRIRPLFNDFDILPQKWLDGNFNINVRPYYTGTFSNPALIIQKAKETTKSYHVHLLSNT